MAEVVSNVYAVKSCSNLHVVSICERTDAIIKEVLLCESATANDLFEPDKVRIVAYNQELRDYVDWAKSRPKLDLPHSHPNTYVMDYCAYEVSRHIQNRSMRDLARLYEEVLVQFSESESARLSSGLIAHDVGRFDRIMDQIDALLNFMDGNLPLDKPESTPHAAQVAQGSNNSAPTHS